MSIRVLMVALLLALAGCSGASEPAAEEPTVDEKFADDVRAIAGDKTDAEIVDEAKGVCFEVEMHVKTRKDLELFITVFSARGVVAPEDTFLFLARTFKTYCPEVERFRPDLNA